MADCRADDPRPDNPVARDIVESRNAYRDALAACNADKRALREWSEGLTLSPE